MDNEFHHGHSEEHCECIRRLPRDESHEFLKILMELHWQRGRNAGMREEAMLIAGVLRENHPCCCCDDDDKKRRRDDDDCERNGDGGRGGRGS
jgi:hypothetical protein